MENFDFICKNLNPTLLFVNKKICTETGISHFHDYIELTFLLEGCCRYELNGNLYDVKKNDILFINPNDTHTTIVTDEKNPPTLFAIGFTDIFLTGLNMKENVFKFENISPVFSCPDELASNIKKIIDDILSEKANNLPGKYFYIHAALVQLLLTIIRYFYRPAAENNSMFLEESNGEALSVNSKKQIVELICEYMNENYAKKISLDTIAANMYLSPIYISKLFKEEMGDSPINYLISIRLKKASGLLKNSRMPISEISTLVGYENPYYFSKLFKKNYGVAPKDYRNQK